MTDSSSLALIDRFLELVTVGEPPSLERLAHALDELALSIYEAPDGSPSELEDDPPERRYQAVHAELAARFPDLGHYPVTDPLYEVHWGRHLRELSFYLHAVRFYK